MRKLVKLECMLTAIFYCDEWDVNPYYTYTILPF